MQAAQHRSEAQAGVDLMIGAVRDLIGVAAFYAHVVGPGSQLTRN
jgi:hypothetical protein